MFACTIPKLDLTLRKGPSLCSFFKVTTYTINFFGRIRIQYILRYLPCYQILTLFLFSFSSSAYLHKANLTLRKALAYLDASIAVGLLVENWSAYPLSKPTVEIQEGKVLQENTSIPVPGSVKAGTMNAGIILQSKVKNI